MRRPDELVHSRARVENRYAMFPLEGYPSSRLPTWPGADVKILAAPALAQETGNRGGRDRPTDPRRGTRSA